MTFACTFTIVRDVKIRDSKFYIIVAVSTIIPLILNMFIFSELLLHLKDPLDALYLIPISGMILGNTLNGMIVTINDFLNNLKLNEESYLLSLSFGATKFEALKPFIANAITLAFKPSVAIKYQISIMIALFVCRFLSSFILLYFCSLYFFNKYSIFTLKIKE